MLIRKIKYINFTNEEKCGTINTADCWQTAQIYCAESKMQRRLLMSNVKRVYVEKKPEFGVTAKELRHELRHYLGITGVSGVRVLIRYDVENITDETIRAGPAEEYLQSLRLTFFTGRSFGKFRRQNLFG